jgi:hypothetical protein
MWLIEIGFTTALLLVGMVVSMFWLMPLPWRLKRYVMAHRRPAPKPVYARMNWLQRSWEWMAMTSSQVTVFLFHTALIVSMYVFMGISVTAHISVISFELLWHLVVAPLYVWYNDNKYRRAR